MVCSVSTYNQVSRYIELHRYVPYCLGKFDCFIFLTDIIELLTGINYRYVVQERYFTEGDYKRLFCRYGAFKDSIDTYTGVKGIERINKDFSLQDADVCLFYFLEDRREHVGVFMQGYLIFPATIGLGFISSNYSIVKVWRF